MSSASWKKPDTHIEVDKMGEFINARLSETPAVRSEDMTPLQKAKAEMDFFKSKGNHFGYKQAKKHYERLLRKEGSWKKNSIK